MSSVSPRFLFINTIKCSDAPRTLPLSVVPQGVQTAPRGDLGRAQDLPTPAIGISPGHLTRREDQGDTRRASSLPLVTASGRPSAGCHGGGSAGVVAGPTGAQRFKGYDDGEEEGPVNTTMVTVMMTMKMRMQMK